VDRCPYRARHWRIVYGYPGMRTPVCWDCGSPNPKPLSEQEWINLIDWARDHYVSDHVRAAIEAHPRENP